MSLAFIWINNWLFCIFFSSSEVHCYCSVLLQVVLPLLLTLVGAAERPNLANLASLCLPQLFHGGIQWGSVWFWSDTWSSWACCHILCYDQSLLLPAWCQAEANQMWDGWTETEPWSCLFIISYYLLFFKLQQHTGIPVMELDHNILSKNPSALLQ